MITEYMSGGEVFSILQKRKSVNESVAAKIIKQLLLAINYLHGKLIVHRDLKPENMMLEREEGWEIKVIDFGLSRLYQKDKKMC